MQRPWRAEAGGVRLDVRLTPRGGRDGVDGLDQLADGRAVLRCRVRAAPTEGEANAALVALIARALDLPRRDVELVSGATARVKTLRLTGEAQAIMAQLDRLVSGS